MICSVSWAIQERHEGVGRLGAKPETWQEEVQQTERRKEVGTLEPKAGTWQQYFDQKELKRMTMLETC